MLPAAWTSEQQESGRATLNQLVLALTDDKHYDNTFLHTFMSTYRSFTKPWILLDKLKEK